MIFLPLLRAGIPDTDGNISVSRLRSFATRIVGSGLFIGSGLFSQAAAAGTETANVAQGRPLAPAENLLVKVPLHIDYPLLEQLLSTQLFTGPAQSRDILEDPSGCSEIVLSGPALRPADLQLELLADVNARIGFGSAGNCATMLSWRGKIGIRGLPESRDNGNSLGFDPEKIWLMNPAGQPVSNPQVQSLAEASVGSVFRRFNVDLLPQIQSMEQLLPDVLPQHSKAQIEALLSTLRVTGLQVTKETLNAEVAFSVEPLSEPLKPERALNEDELQRWEERWQLMDSLLVLAVKHYAATTQLKELRGALLEALIESRYRLRDALSETPSTGEDMDLVREWFLQSWKTLVPIIQRIAIEQPDQEHLLLISVIAASDALEALDQLGPSVGLDISVSGLRRLARMINGSAGDELLIYSEVLDPQLRQLFEESYQTVSPPVSWQWDVSFFPKAIAADNDRLNSWAPKRQDMPEYLPLVAGLMENSIKDAIASRKLNPAYRDLFRNLVLTTAWQESCWKHYTVSKDRKLVPVRSGTGDVGLMQINERVWRGFYDQQRLRWDIAYNSDAGAEVLIDYLTKYAIRKGEHKQPGGLSNLARSAYSSYNGGPSKVARYRSSTASAYGKKVDAAFWEKYQQVAAGNELAVSTCHGANLSGPAIRKTASKGASSDAATLPSTGFTLQLGAFSTAEAARTFIEQQTLGGAAKVRRRKDSQGSKAQYLVVYGNYASRAAAENAKKSLRALAPWIRPFADL